MRSLHIPLILVGILLLAGCTQPPQLQGMDSLRENPLTADSMASRAIDYVTNLQIRANEAKKPITDAKILRVIDDVLVDMRLLQDEAKKQRDEGKFGTFYGVNENYAKGRVLLAWDHLYFGNEFELDAAPGVVLYLAESVAPRTPEELFGEPTKQLGNLQSYFGAQRYAVMLSADERNAFRTVALFSKPMNSIIALAQIHMRVPLQ